MEIFSRDEIVCEQDVSTMKFRFTQILWSYLNASSVNDFTVWRPNTKLKWNLNDFTDISRLSEWRECCPKVFQLFSWLHTRLESQCTGMQQSPVIKWHQQVQRQGHMLKIFFLHSWQYPLLKFLYCVPKSVKSVLHWLQKEQLKLLKVWWPSVLQLALCGL